MLKREERLFPRERYWDRYFGGGRLRALSFQDAPALGEFTCAEGSHMDQATASRFSEALGHELMADDLIPSAASP